MNRDTMLPWRPIALGVTLLPVAALLSRIGTAAFQANPPEAMVHLSGRAAFWLLVATLTIRPLQRRGVRGILPARRTLGLAAFAWATVHLALVLLFDYHGDVSALLPDLASQRHLAFGIVAWLLLMPLAATSNRRSMRALGARWQRLHRLVWPALFLAWAHLYTKERVTTTLLAAATAAVLLLIAVRLSSKRRSRPPL